MLAMDPWERLAATARHAPHRRWQVAGIGWRLQGDAREAAREVRHELAQVLTSARPLSGWMPSLAVKKAVKRTTETMMGLAGVPARSDQRLHVLVRGGGEPPTPRFQPSGSPSRPAATGVLALWRLGPTRPRLLGVRTIGCAQTRLD